MDIRRGIIRAFDSATYLAHVQIVGSMATMLTGVPVAKEIGAYLLTSGIKCGVLFFDETNPDDACVVFIYGEAHPGHITIPQGKEFRPGGDANTAFGEDGSGNAYLKDAVAGTKTLSELAAGGGNPESLDVVTSEIEVVNTTTQTTIYSFTVPGGMLGTNNLLRLFIQFSYLNNTSASRNFTVRVKYGGTTFFAEQSSLIPVSATRRSGRFEISLKGNGATNAQRGMWAPVLIGGTDAQLYAFPGEGTLAVDSTLDKDLVVTVQHGLANLQASFIRRWATLEKMEAL